jgi:pyridinium-3,5-bisthiocarboxylic acid mononucleotide nickel chelatase
MRIGYLECFAGISGDMLLGALADADVPADLLVHAARALDIGAELKVERVDRSGIHSTKIDVLVDGAPAETRGHHHESQHKQACAHKHSYPHDRSWKEIRELISRATLREDAKTLAQRTFAILAQAEGKIHGVPADGVHFHEVGNVDTIADIVCGAAGLCSLNVERWYASPVNVGAGHVHCAHGRFPVPAPATAELLKGVPTYAAGPQRELTTPTGAALLRALGCTFGAAPVMVATAIGYGAGTANPEGFPNVLRLTVGESVDTPNRDHVVVLECAIDDASPQVLAHTMELALENGALDVMAGPVTMKKGRLGTLLTVLAKPEDAPALEGLLFRETTTLGIRRRTDARVVLDRSFVTVETAYGLIRVKVGSLGGERRNAMPEYEDCRRAAREHGAPLKQVIEAALAAFAEHPVKA